MSDPNSRSEDWLYAQIGRLYVEAKVAAENQAILAKGLDEMRERAEGAENSLEAKSGELIRLKESIGETWSDTQTDEDSGHEQPQGT